MTGRGGARIAVAIAGVVLVGGSLAGCSRGLLHSQPAPAAGVSTTAPSTAPSTAAPGASSGSSAATLQGIQDDLDSSDSATSNAGGDVADADSSAATNDSP